MRPNAWGGAAIVADVLDNAPHETQRLGWCCKHRCAGVDYGNAPSFTRIRHAFGQLDTREIGCPMMFPHDWHSPEHAVGRNTHFRVDGEPTRIRPTALQTNSEAMAAHALEQRLGNIPWSHAWHVVPMTQADNYSEGSPVFGPHTHVGLQHLPERHALGF